MSKKARRPIYLVPNDLIGGFDISYHNFPVSMHDHDKGEYTLAWGVDKEWALEVIALWMMSGMK